MLHRGVNFPNTTIYKLGVETHINRLWKINIEEITEYLCAKHKISDQTRGAAFDFMWP